MLGRILAKDKNVRLVIIDLNIEIDHPQCRKPPTSLPNCGNTPTSWPRTTLKRPSCWVRTFDAISECLPIRSALPKPFELRGATVFALYFPAE